MEKYFRVFKFMGQVVGMAATNPVLLMPILINIVVGVISSLVLSMAYTHVDNQSASFFILGIGVIFLYFVDYFNNGITVSLVYDQITSGKADLGAATSNTLQSAPGIMAFATLSGFFDMLVSYAQERDDVVGKIIANVLYMIWTTATYMILPTMVIEKTGFFAAFGRAKEVMKNDPTQAGIGVIGIGIVNYILGAICFIAAYASLQALAPKSLMLGAFVFFFLVNIYWGVSGYLKTTYFTCFYLWAKNCEKEQSSAVSLAPAPLAAALAA